MTIILLVAAAREGIRLYKIAMDHKEKEEMYNELFGKGE
jgi:hypothetical protein